MLQKNNDFLDSVDEFDKSKEKAKKPKPDKIKISLLLLILILAIFLGWLFFIREKTYKNVDYGYSFKIPRGWTLEKNNVTSFPPYVVEKNVVDEKQIVGPIYRSRMNSNEELQSFIKIMVIDEDVNFQDPIDFVMEAGLMQENIFELSGDEKYLKKTENGGYIIDSHSRCIPPGCQDYRIFRNDNFVYLLSMPSLGYLTIADEEYRESNEDIKNDIEHVIETFKLLK